MKIPAFSSQIPALSRVLSVLLVILIFLIVVVRVTPTNAAVASCTATVSPTSVTTYSQTDFLFTIENTDSVAYNWIKITVPSSSFEVTGTNVVGNWSITNNASTVTLTNSTLAAGTNLNITVNAKVLNVPEATGNWTVQVSDQGSSEGAYNCTGNLTGNISGTGTDTIPPVITNLKVDSVSDTSVTIKWTTDESATSNLEYGTTTSYGTTVNSSTLTTSHSLEITGLTAETSYHFYIWSADSLGNETYSDDNTFNTSSTPTTTTVTTTVTTTETITETVEKLIEDTEKPGISFETDFEEIFSSTPIITGTVTDNQGVGSVEYSIDGGANWLPVDDVSSPRATSTNFSFTVFGLLDGNYKVRVRATDLSGNSTTSSEQILIFDRLPPAVGTVALSLGPQIMSTSTAGELITIAGIDQRVTLSAIGGPTEIQINVKCQMSNVKCLENEPDQIFALTKNPETGLWSGTMSFAGEGTYTLSVKSTDGAGNVTERQLNDVMVLPKGKISYLGEGIQGAEIFIYYFEPTTENFTLWDAKAYGQENPLFTKDDGSYSLILPTGTYYLEAKTPGFATLTTNIFEVERTTPVNVNFDLENQKFIGIGNFKLPLPGIFQPAVEIEEESFDGSTTLTTQDKEFPFFELTDNTANYNPFNFRGKPTVYTFLSTWHPQTAEQLGQLDKLANELNINLVVVFPQESVSKVSIFSKLGGYNALMLADPDGVLFSELNLSTLPTHVFVDRAGVVDSVVVGVLGSEEIVEKIY